MPLFGRRRAQHTSTPTRWEPTVDMASARPAVFALANTPSVDEMRVFAALNEFTRLAEAVPMERAVQLIGAEPDVVSRPWKWLVAVLREAGAIGDHHLAVAGLYWACYWTSSLVPRNNNVGFFMEMKIDPIPTALKLELVTLGVASARQLPENFVIVGDASGQILAGPLASAAPSLLGLEQR